MKIIIIFLFITAFISGCDRMQEKQTVEKEKAPVKDPHSGMQGMDTKSESNSSGKSDEKAEEFIKLADESYEKYKGDNSESNKKEMVKNCMAAGNYLMFEASLPAKEKYRPALKYYRKVLEADPKNNEALTNKKQIEDIYEQMGMPIPQ
ncbi:MAG: hypothetical protein HGGPFJEG_01923 [Ignavibacteria bacterium]|nr:hypothetical protein [Ignavibacteria bacterium]